MYVTMTTLNEHLNKLQSSMEYARKVNAESEYPYSIKKVNGKYQVYNGYYDDPKNKLMIMGCEPKVRQLHNTIEDARQEICNQLIKSAEISIRGYIWSDSDCC